MTSRSDIHFELLHVQVNSIFKYYSEHVTDKWCMANFEPLVDDGQVVVSYKVDQDPDSPARRQLSITVTVDGRDFRFFQNYSYGVMLSGGVQYTPSNPDKDISDLEYALSIGTEQTAYQLSKQGL